MASPKIPGGYYIKARIIKQKKIAHCAPCVREIWDYLLREATYKDHGTLKKGQLLVRYQDMIDSLKWFVGYRKMSYSMDQTKKAMKVLRSHLMITTTKARGGVLVTLLNHEFYNDLKNYEGTNEGTNESTNESTVVPPTINKKGKELKNDNNYSEDSKEFRLSLFLLNNIRKRKPDYKIPDLQKWSIQSDYILRIDKRDIEEVKKVVIWCQTDEFWQDNILSVAKLRKQYDQLVLKMNKPINKKLSVTDHNQIYFENLKKEIAENANKPREIEFIDEDKPF